MISVEMNNLTLDLEITEYEGDFGEYTPKDKIILTHELFSKIHDLSTFKKWLATMNLKIGAKK